MGHKSEPLFWPQRIRYGYRLGVERRGGLDAQRNEVIELAGCREKRCRLMPAPTVVYFVLGLCLDSGADSAGPPLMPLAGWRINTAHPAVTASVPSARFYTEPDGSAVGSPGATPTSSTGGSSASAVAGSSAPTRIRSATIPVRFVRVLSICCSR